MENIEILKKKISTYRSPGGKVRNVSDELLYEVLVAWENWTGSKSAFYTAIGVSQKGFASILGKAKKMKREGHFPDEDFKEIMLSTPPSAGSTTLDDCGGIILHLNDAAKISFPQVEYLIDFIKKAS